jgi:hypothetical protein
VSNPCGTAREGWPKTCNDDGELAEPDPPCCPSHEKSLPGKQSDGGPPETRGNNVDSDGTKFRWAEWSPRVARLNAPKDDGAHLIEPPLSLAQEMTTSNHAILSASDYDVQGRSLASLAQAAQEQLFNAALRYTRSYRDVIVPAKPARLILAGHQPEVFHPGVWLKNFVLARLAGDQNAVAVNLQIDSDTMKTASLRVPGGSLESPRLEYIPFDRGAPELPFEQRGIIDQSCFASFGKRAADHLQPLVEQPLLERYWPLAVARAKETGNAGASISQARHQTEASWGLQTLEIPQSQVCDLPAVRWFIAHLLVQLPRFWEIYNSALMTYRREHKIRSAAHPVPELDSDGRWLEAPLWIWSQSDPERRQLFVRQRDDQLFLSDRQNIEVAVSITPDGDAAAAVDQLAALAAQGIRLRTRALITTLAARLLLGDLFVHGIGGAKYDQLTDRIIEQFFGVTAPGYMVVSGTLHLPLSRPALPTTETVPQIRQRIRELQFHPERFLGTASASATADQKSATLIAEKRRWLDTAQTTDNARQRCRAIRQINDDLQPAVASLRELWSSQTTALANGQRLDALLRSREYPFALFPEPVLTKFLLRVLANPRVKD